MDKESNHTSNGSTRRSRSASISASTQSGSSTRVSDHGAAPLASSAILPQPEGAHDDHYESFVHALRAAQGIYPSLSPSSGFPVDLFGLGQMGNPQLPPFSPPNFPWQELAAQSSQQGQRPSQHHPPPFNPEMIHFPYAGSAYVPVLPVGSSRGASAAQSVASASTSSPDVAEQTEAESRASAEDKRIRNTAASARFRIKKKLRALNLERSVSDLTGRADELEKEAADLRRENSWLKEIVILKGSRLARVNTSNNSAPLQADEGSSQRRMGEKTGETAGDGQSGDSGSGESSEDGAAGGAGRRNKGKRKTKGKGKERERE